MNIADYISQLSDRRKDITDSEYLDYLWNNRDSADLESTICVQVAAYCDPELISTLRSCVENAANPDRIHLVVCHQSDDEDELAKVWAFKNCKVKHFPKDKAPGTCAARYECNKLIADEDYIMHLDSHMRFAPFWDVCLMQQWTDCDDPKAIITAYGTNYARFVDEPLIMSDKFVPRKVDGKIMNAKHFESYTVKLRPYMKTCFPGDSTKPRQGAFVSAHFTFAKAELDRNIPFDPNMYFVADEISMAVRYWTHGYNIYHPAFRCIYHLYSRVEVLKDSHGVDVERVNRSIQKEAMEREQLRMEQLFRVCNHDCDLTGFDLGKERSIEEYQTFAGIDFKTKTILNFAHNGFFDTKHSEFDLKPSNWLLESEADYKVAHKEELSKRTILVMIPSYKDPYLMMTVKSFRDNADNPDRIHFAVCYQDDDMETLKELQSIEHCKVIHVLPQDATGVGYAYHLLESTLEDEDYVLRTESHMYAVKGWDSHLIGEVDELGDKAVISNWLGGFSKERPLPTGPQPSRVIGLLRISDTYLFNIVFAGTVVSNTPARGAFIIGNNVFGKAQFIRDCKHDPYMLMNSAEAAYTLSLWTHGYDVYHSNQRYLYHYYSPYNDDSTRDKINKQRRDEEVRVSIPRIKRYIGIIDDSNATIDLGEYGPGTERTIKAFECFTGIDYRGKKVSVRSILGKFTTDNVVDKYVDIPEFRKFMDEHNINIPYVSEFDSKLSVHELPGITYLK